MSRKDASMKMHAFRSAAGLPLAAALLIAVRAGAASAQQLETPAPALSVNVQNFQPLVPGLLVRSRFTVEEAGRRVELLDLLVGPGKRSARTSFAGPTVLELRAGDAVLVVGDRPQRITSGAAIHVPARVGIEIANVRADLDVSIRATVITEGPR
jgi:hypothetical protein